MGDDSATLELSATPSAPGQARTFALDMIRRRIGADAPDALRDDVALVVSELVTNAVRAGSPTVSISVEVLDGRVAVHVTDMADGWPMPREAAYHEPGGRGLALVSAVAASWGARLDEDSKTVWAELTVAS